MSLFFHKVQYTRAHLKLRCMRTAQDKNQTGNEWQILIFLHFERIQYFFFVSFFHHCYIAQESVSFCNSRFLLVSPFYFFFAAMENELNEITFALRHGEKRRIDLKLVLVSSMCVSLASHKRQRTLKQNETSHFSFFFIYLSTYSGYIFVQKCFWFFFRSFCLFILYFLCQNKNMFIILLVDWFIIKTI